MDHEQLVIEARAKLVWGEQPERVLLFLRARGISEQQALGLIGTLQAERLAAIRGTGRRKIFTGSLLVGSAILIWFIIFTVVVAYIPQRLSGKIFLLPLLLGVLGLWKLSGGLMLLLSPKSERGDIGRLDD